ncbi:PAS domain-containing protein [Marinobacter lacisalsi]|uniref:histidine kinase n=1 Tax=Marinobacter lacisalsi TaxID=475979 RepID=A0ABV8QCK3_9GAMM
MKAPDNPVHEQARLTALKATGLLDTEPEERFDRLTRMAVRFFDVPIALVTLVDSNRQWFKSCQGLDVSETPREISFCGHAILKTGLFIIEDATLDDRFNDNPLVTGAPYIRFYAGAPLLSSDGHRLGTLCLIDSRPRQLDPMQQEFLRDLANSVSHEIQLHRNQDVFDDLVKRERRAQAIIEGTQVGTWEWDVQTGETVFNERWANICGYTLAELQPVDIQTWLDLAHPDDLAESEQRLDAHFAGAAAEYDYRCRMRHKDGHWVWVHDRGKVLEWTTEGLPRKMYGTHADITREMDNVHRMEQQNQALATLNDLALDQVSPAEEKLGKALKLGAGFLRMPTAILSEILGGTYTIKGFHAPDNSGLFVGQTFPFEETYCNLMLQGRGYLAIEHMARSSYRDHACYQAFGLESYIAAPIRTRNGPYGTINFSSTTPRAEGFTETEITFVTLLAEWVAGVLDEQLTTQTLSKLVENIPGTLYQYRRWQGGTSAFPYASPGIANIFGVSPQDVESDASAAFDAIHPQDLEPVSESIELSANQLTLWFQQYRVRSGDGWRWIEGRATPERLADGSTMWHGYITDIDDRKRAQLLIQDSEEQLRRLFELSPIGIALTDFESGRILDVNDALLQPTGFSRSEFMALSTEDLLPDRHRQLRKTSIQELKTNWRFGPYECEIAGAKGSHFPAVVQGMLISSASDRPLVWTLVEDISERKKVDRMKSEFISTVSHELRTPLTSISGSLSLVANEVLGELPDRVRELVSIAARNSDQLRRLIDDLLDMEKLLSGQMTFVPRPHCIETLTRETLEQLETYALDKQVAVTLMVSDPDIEATVDGQRLQQALSNLFSNAIKFSPTEGEVAVTITATSTAVTVDVSDQGPGIPDEFRSRIFQKFAQADGSMNRSQGGTGLGLAITREIMLQMGGEVGFESTPGHGARFWLTFPRVPVA